MMIRRSKRLFVLLLAASVMIIPTANAFSDVTPGGPYAAAIDELQKAGVVDGMDAEHYAPGLPLTYAQGVSLLVRGMKLNLDGIRFIKQPQASDSFTRVPNDAWFAEAFIVAQLNGLDVPSTVDPAQPMTREQFGHLLMQAVHKQASFVINKMLVRFADEDQLSQDGAADIRTLLATGIGSLDADQRFHPLDPITRGDAAVLTASAIRFVQEHPMKQETVTVAVEKVTDAVNKITLSWGLKPNPGYRLSIDRITFTDTGEAQIGYSLHLPQPGFLYADVITEAKASTYVDSSYKAVAVPLSN